MAVYIVTVFLLVTLPSFGKGQNYFIGEDNAGGFYLDQTGLNNRPAQFYPSTSIQSQHFYIPRDLQTSELPSHLQQTLPQYQQSTPSRQDFHLNSPSHFAFPKEYVKPSTHRPDYSHLLPRRYHNAHLGTQASYERSGPTSHINQLESSLGQFNRNDYETEKQKQPIKSNTNIDPLSYNNKESNNQVELHFNKRDNANVATRGRLNNDEFLGNPDDETLQSEDENTLPENNDDKLNEKANNDLDDAEYEDEYEYDDENNGDEADSEINENSSVKNKTFEVITMNPTTTNQENKFTDFVDVESLDTTTQEPATSNILTQPPIAAMPKNHNYSNDNKDIMEFPHLVVSVVTSKTTVNNTIISPIGYIPLNVSTQPSIGVPGENSTDSWMVIASVQTSRSVSGPQIFPPTTLKSNDRQKLLNEEASPPGIKDILPEIDLPSSTKTKTSTESLIDKLDRVQSDLSSGLLTGGYKNDNIAVIEENLSTKIETTTEELTTTPLSTSIKEVTTKAPYPQVNIRKFNAGNRATRPKSKLIEPKRKNPTPSTTTKSTVGQNGNPINKDITSVLQSIKPVDDISALLPPGYKPPPASTIELPLDSILSKIKPVDNIPDLLPPGYKPPESTSTEKSTDVIHSIAKPVDDISALLPPGYKLPPTSASTEKLPKSIISKLKPVEDISALLPPGYKPPRPESTEKIKTNISTKAKPVDDISALLPPGYKSRQTGSTEKSVNNLLSKAKVVDDISALLPPGYRGFTKPKATSSPKHPGTVGQNLPANLLPPGFIKSNANNENLGTSTSPSITSSHPASTTSTGFKVVFPSRPGGGSRKTPRLTTPRVQNEEIMNKPTLPTIQKGWPIRSSTEFTGWPTPSTTPISIEKLLEAARAAATSTSTVTPTEPSSTTTTTTTTTTTPRPTTPGVCIDGCDLAGTIKIVGGAKWAPELLDPNTKEYQLLANSVQSELENIYNRSPVLKSWYRKIRIDGFSEGSILVDYLVEFNEIGHKVDTQEIKRLFHESLTDAANAASTREAKSLNESKAEKLSLGQFEMDPKYTDFVVIPKHSYPTVGYADNVLLPQWAIAVIVIGLASLLFVIIFGVTVLFNRHKNAKKTPAPLSEDMLNELDKNHMGGYDNYDVEDFYNMEDVWSDKHYEQKPPKKRTNDSLYDNSTSNLYDSWRSQWNGQQWNAYSNSYYGRPNSSQHSGYSGHRRPNHDTDF